MIPETDYTKERQQSFVSVGQSGTVVGLKVLTGGPKDTTRFARVVSVSTNNIFAPIQDMCGMGDSIDLRIGMTEAQVLDALAAATTLMRESDKDFACDHFTTFDDGNLGYLSEIYFPGERLKLAFSNRALVAATIYLPMTDVNTNVPEVSK